MLIKSNFGLPTGRRFLASEDRYGSITTETMPYEVRLTTNVGSQGGRPKNDGSMVHPDVRPKGAACVYEAAGTSTSVLELSTLS